MDRNEALRLLKDYAPMARAIAKGFKRRLPSHIPLEDVTASAMAGLWDAVRLRPEAASFENYARIRIRGAIRDDLRTADWLPRSARRDPGSPFADYVIERDTALLERERSTEDVEADFMASVAASRARAAIAAMPERLRRVLEAAVSGVGLRDLAAELGVSQPRVSQLRADAMGRVRSALAEDAA